MTEHGRLKGDFGTEESLVIENMSETLTHKTSRGTRITRPKAAMI
jgi:hypothetical protein